MRTNLARLLAIVLHLSLISSVNAQSLIANGITGCDFAEGTFGAECIPAFIAHVIEQIFQFTGALALLMIMIGGFEYALDKIAGGKERGIKRIQHGVIGMIISAFAFFIVRFFRNAIAGV